MISARGLEVTLDHRKILSGINFDSVPGGVVAVMGPSGCGKSTLLRALMGLHTFDSGELCWSNQRVQASTWSKKQSVFTLVPQIPLLLPWKTLIQNVALAAAPSANPDTAIQKAAELLGVVGLMDAQSYYPWQVSQGMAARASLARTLMMESQVLLLDEPFAAIDATTRFKLQRWLLETISALSIQAIMVTHDPREALLVGDVVIVLGGRPAQVVTKFELPSRNKRAEPDWIFGIQAGELEKQIRASLGS